jgi:hypothetical protein
MQECVRVEVNEMVVEVGGRQMLIPTQVRGLVPKVPRNIHLGMAGPVVMTYQGCTICRCRATPLTLSILRLHYNFRLLLSFSPSLYPLRDSSTCGGVKINSSKLKRPIDYSAEALHTTHATNYTKCKKISNKERTNTT